MWAGLVCVLVWSIKEKEESLEEMGLVLDEDGKEDVLDVVVAVTPGSGCFMNDDDCL